jgi:hypothetical protein
MAGSVTAGKSRAMAEGPQMPTATSQKWNSAWPQSQSVGAAHKMMRYCGRAADQKRSAQEQKDQANVADEVLVEWTGCRDTRHSEVPTNRRVEHIEAIHLSCDAQHDGQAKTELFQHG